MIIGDKCVNKSKPDLLMIVVDKKLFPDQIVYICRYFNRVTGTFFQDSFIGEELKPVDTHPGEATGYEEPITEKQQWFLEHCGVKFNFEIGKLTKEAASKYIAEVKTKEAAAQAAKPQPSMPNTVDEMQLPWDQPQKRKRGRPRKNHVIN